MRVALTIEEFGRAFFTAYDRLASSLRKGRKDRLFDKDWKEHLEVHLSGAIGETAVAKALGIYAPLHVNEFRGGRADLGEDIEVRYRTKADYDLIIRHDDPKDKIYVLARGPLGDVEIAGWCHGNEGREDRFKKNYGGYGSAYFIPASELRPMGELIQLLHARGPSNGGR